MDGIDCDVCKSIDDVKTPAVGSCNDCLDNLCELCFTNHTRNRMTRNHVLEYKPSQSKSLTRPTSACDKEKTICQEHQQDISLFCKLHDAVGCSVCMKMYHLFCHQSNISDVALGIGDTKETETLKCDIEGLKKMYKDTMQRSKDQIADIEQIHTNAVKAIKETMDRLKQLQHKSENEVAHIKDTDITKMKSVADNCEEMLSQIDILGAELDFDGDTLDDKCMFIKVKQAKPKIKPINNHLKKVQHDNKITRYEFTAKNLDSATHDMDSLGKVSNGIQLGSFAGGPTMRETTIDNTKSNNTLTALQLSTHSEYQIEAIKGSDDATIPKKDSSVVDKVVALGCRNGNGNDADV